MAIGVLESPPVRACSSVSMSVIESTWLRRQRRQRQQQIRSRSGSGPWAEFVGGRNNAALEWQPYLNRALHVVTTRHRTLLLYEGRRRLRQLSAKTSCDSNECIVKAPSTVEPTSAVAAASHHK